MYHSIAHDEWGQGLVGFTDGVQTTHSVDPQIYKQFVSCILTDLCGFMWLSHPGNRGTYCFWSVSAAAAVLPTLFNFLGTPLKLISSNHTWLTYECGKIFWHPFQWPWVKVTKLPKRNAIYHVPMVKWEPFIQSLEKSVGISPSSCFPVF